MFSFRNIITHTLNYFSYSSLFLTENCFFLLPFRYLKFFDRACTFFISGLGLKTVFIADLKQ